MLWPSHCAHITQANGYNFNNLVDLFPEHSDLVHAHVFLLPLKIYGFCCWDMEM